MAYGVKFELFFQDVEERRFKVEILKNGYSGTVKSLVGTGDPVEIIWEGNDDIYSPIIGSRCILNLMVTDDTDYDEFYQGDEREYKIKVLRQDTAGSFWEAEETPWELYDANWEADNDPNFFQPIWEGFMVIDRFREQMIHKPYPITLEAVDGLGTLEGFDAPFDTSDNTTTTNLFYHLKEILKLTGHEHRIYISNDIRKTDGAANDTIFHDIEVDKYALFTKNLTFRTAKDVLKQILMITNSRIYHSFARWYVVNNSSLIDSRIDQLAEAPSGADTNLEPAPEPDPFTFVPAPSITLIANSSTASTVNVYENQNILFIAQTIGGGTPDSYSWTTPTGNTYTSSGISFPALSSYDGATVSVTATNDEGSSTDSCVINILTTPEPDPPSPTDVGGTITINIDNLVANSVEVSPNPGSLSFNASQVGNGFNISFALRPSPGYKFTNNNQYSLGTISGYTVAKSSILNGVANFNVSGTIPSGGFTENLTVTGTAPVEQFTTTVSFVNNVSNTTFTTTQFTFTGATGSSFSETRTLMPDDDFFFSSLANVGAFFTTGRDVTRTLELKTRDASGKNPIDVTISGTIQDSDVSDTLTIGGEPLTTNDASGFNSGVSAVSSLNVPGSYSYIPSSNIFSNPNNVALFNGRFKVDAVSVDGLNTPQSWVTISPREGDEETKFITLTFQGNYSYGGDRYARIRFLAYNTDAVLHTISITQNSLTIF
jgi:hypothetical protein